MQTNVCRKNIHDRAYLSIGVTSGVGRGYAGCLDGSFQGYRGEAMQDLGYELRRISIPHTWVNKGKKGPRRSRPRSFAPRAPAVAFSRLGPGLADRRS